MLAVTTPACFARYRSPQSDAEACCDECRVEASCMVAWKRTQPIRIPRFAEHVDPLAQIERRDRVFRMARACSACGSEQVQWRRLLLE